MAIGLTRKTLIALIGAVVMLALLLAGTTATAAPSKVVSGNPQSPVNGQLIPHVIVHYEHNGKSHPGGGPGGGGGGGDETDHSGHYALLPGKWAGDNPVVTYVVDDPGIAGAVQAIQNSFQAWEDVSGIDFSFRGTADVNPNAELAGPNGQNTVSWALLVGTWTNALAVTVLWFEDDGNGVWDGEPIIEAEMIFNTKYTWAIDPDGEGPQKPNVKGKWFDIQNVGIHEAGHFVGLDDQCNWDDETMFCSASSGETKKRSLEPGDIAGAVALYGP